MKTLTLCFISMFIYMQPLFAQIPQVTWEKELSVPSAHFFSDVHELSDGNLILLGAIEQPRERDFDIWLLELNSNGDTLRTRIFGNIGKDIPMRLLSVDEKGYLLAFLKESKEKVLKSCLMAVDPDFKELWTVESEKPSFLNRSDIAAENAGNIWWLNTVQGQRGVPEVTLNKLDAGGNKEKDVVLNLDFPAEGCALRMLPDGTVAMSVRMLPPGKKSYVQVTRISNTGEVLWKTTIPDANKNLSPQCLCCSPDNTLLAGGWAGMCYNPDAPAEEQIWDYDYLLSKIDASGNLLWTQNYNREGSEKGTAVAVLPDGNIMAAGKCETSFTGTIGPWLLLVDKNGNKVQDQVYKFRFVKDQVARIICTKDGGLLMVGPGFTETESQMTGWLRKLNPVM